MDALLEILQESLNLSPTQVADVERMFILLIMLPVVSTITGFFRYVIGLKSVNIYAPIALTFAFYELGYVADTEGIIHTDFLRGIQFGIALFAIVFFASTTAYSVLKKIRMHYTPKTTLIMTFVSIVLITSIFLTTWITGREGLINPNIIFSIIIIGTLSDTFVSLMARKDFNYTLRLGIETLLIALFSFAFIAWKDAREVIIEYPWISLLVVILINLYLGRYVGLRIKEYWRFRNILIRDEQKDVSTDTRPTKK